MWPHVNRQSIRAQRGLARSVITYYGIPWRHRQLVNLYRTFIAPGDLCFDVGAHVGNRVRAWTSIGARVVALEPQPICLRFLERWYGHNPQVIVVGAAVGALPGTQELKVSQATPTVTSMSSRWIDTVQQVDSFAGVRWDEAIPVHVTTLDQLICAHGLPAFCKIDVEGYEFEVLQGLSQPLPALSIEFVPATLDVTHACLQRLAALGEYEYNWTLGERHEWCSSWGDADQVTSFLNTLPPTGPSGDIYARQVSSGGHSVHAAT